MKHVNLKEIKNVGDTIKKIFSEYGFIRKKML